MVVFYAVFSHFVSTWIVAWAYFPGYVLRFVFLFDGYPALAVLLLSHMCYYFFLLLFFLMSFSSDDHGLKGVACNGVCVR